MFSILVKKELFTNIKNLRFEAGIILCVVLTVISMVILTGQYKDELVDFDRRLYYQDSFLEQYGHLNRALSFMEPQKQPEKFRPLTVGITWEPEKTKYSEATNFIKDPLPVMFPVTDTVFIVAVLMSLFAILFSYDSVTRERESGTLKLMVTYPVSRVAVLSAKWVSGIITLSIPFILSLLSGMLYIMLHPSIQWGGAEIMTTALFLLGAMTYISSFYLLGMLVSTFTRHSGVSILLGFFVWIVLVLVVPNLSPYVAAQLYKIPSAVEVNRETGHILDTERDELAFSMIKEVDKSFLNEYGDKFMNYTKLSQREKRRLNRSDNELVVMHAAYQKAIDEVRIKATRIQKEKADKILADFERKTDTQTLLAKNIACISPYANFIYVATDLAGTGLRGLNHFKKTSDVYMETAIEYVISAYEKAKQANPSFDSNSFYNMDDRPRYEYVEEAMITRLAGVLPYWMILVFFNILFFVGAYVKFLKYDVR